MTLAFSLLVQKQQRRHRRRSTALGDHVVPHVGDHQVHLWQDRGLAEPSTMFGESFELIVQQPLGDDHNGVGARVSISLRINSMLLPKPSRPRLR